MMLNLENDGDTVLDDGLSDDEDPLSPRQQRPMTSAEAAARAAAAKQHKQCQIFLLFLTWTMSLVVATIKYYSRPGEYYIAGKRNDGPMLEKENELRLKYALEYLTSISGLEFPNPMSESSNMTGDSSANNANYNSPQYQAAEWIAKVDKRRLPIPQYSFNGKSYTSQKDEYPFLQRYALATLFFSTGGSDHWKFQTNFLSGWHECSWFDVFDIAGSPPNSRYVFGVVCDGYPSLEEGMEENNVVGRDWVVTHISLPPMNDMTGTLPAQVSHLRYLKEFHIQLNPGITGPIPSEYGNFRNLRTMNLGYNSLNGTIPNALSQLENLEELLLEYNLLSGEIHFAMNLTSLTNLSLEYNPNITGTIPEGISSLQNLAVLSLSNTDMHGTLPSDMAMLKNLKLLLLDDNKFSGSLDALQNLENLNYVYLEDNLFNDTIDDNFFANLDQLKQVDLSSNNFRGSLPGHFFNFSGLEVLDMSSNSQMKGPLPADAILNATGSNMVHLSLHSMNVTGKIPQGIKMLKNLRHLDLSLNQLSGDIVSEIGELPNLQYLFLGRNSFNEGPLPEWIRNMTQLTELSLKSSSLKGGVPEWVGYDLLGLTFLDLGENLLDGTLPESMGNLTNLWVLILNKNQLNGTIPSSFSQLISLETFLIDDNHFVGNASAVCERKDKIKYFISDCGNSSSSGGDEPEIQCNCCTLCCNDENTTCNDAEWLGNQESIWETGYNRIKWEFEAGDVSRLSDRM